MRCLIFCAGEMGRLLDAGRDEDFVIAADGGLRHTESIGIMPDIILGDFDSLGYVPSNSERHPVEKDDTDAMLAVRRGLEKGCGEFILYGSLDGPRLDHTVANFQTLQFLADRGKRGYLVGVRQIVTVVKDGFVEFPEGLQGDISVFSLDEQSTGVDILGLYYELENGSLGKGFPLGVSNHFTGKKAKIGAKKGSLLIIWNMDAGLPETEEAGSC